jgi:hypothetical protein
VVVVRITVVEGHLVPIRRSVTVTRSTVAEALAAALVDLLPRVRVRLVDVIASARSIAARMAARGAVSGGPPARP